MKTKLLTLAVLAATAVACNSPKTVMTRSGLDPQNFADTVDGKPTALYTLTNKNGVEVCITNFGGRIVSIVTPDRDGTDRDIVLGFDNIGDYLPQNHQTDFGASIGRYANRIGQGRFVLDGTEYQLPQNNFGHCLHGGPDGWQYRVYTASEVTDNSLLLTIDSPDGDEQFPGAVTANVRFTLTDNNAIEIDYTATTDAPTIINMTNHSYFNLTGDGGTNILDHMLTINADSFTPCDSTFMTTGEIVSVEGTPMDFRTQKRVGEQIDDADSEQLRNGNGYDHNWVLNSNGDRSVIAARLYCPATGIGVEVYTNEPGIQVYTGNFLDGTVTGKGGKVYSQRNAICMETQKYPDTPNKPEWPSAVLRPGEEYHSTCTFLITVDR